MKITSFFYSTAIVFLCAGASLSAQQMELAHSVNTAQSIMHGPDIAKVDLLSGALQIRLPLVSMKGRGINTDISLGYVSKMWKTQPMPHREGDDITYNSWSVAAVTDGMGRGWSIGQAGMGDLVDESVMLMGASSLTSGTWRELDGSTTFLVDSNGYIPFTTSGPDCSMCIGGIVPPNRLLWSIDGSYLKQFNSNGSFGIKYKNGLWAYSSSVVNGSPVHVIRDTNGNKVVCSVTSCTDSIGRTFNYGYDAAGNLITLSYLNASGSQSIYRLEYSAKQLFYPYLLSMRGNYCPEDMRVPTGFGTQNEPQAGCVYSPEWRNGPAEPLLTSLTTPTGESYKFEYWINPDGITTSGEVAKVTFPGGGYMRFAYSTGPTESLAMCSELQTTPDNCTTGRPENRVVTDRWDSVDGKVSSEQHWIYSLRMRDPSGPRVISTVTAPDGTKAVETYQDSEDLYQSGPIQAGLPPFPPVHLKSEVKDSSEHILKTVVDTSAFDNTNYNVITLPSSGVRYSYANPRTASRTVSLDSSEQKAVTEYDYDSYGNVKSVRQYDWGSTGTESLLRVISTPSWITTHPSYAVDSIHILDLVASQSVSGPNCGGMAHICKSETYTYDDYMGNPESTGLANTSNLVAHENIGAALRGNRTSSSDGGDTTWTAYDDAGNPVKRWDARGAKTEYSYADSFYEGNPAQTTYAFATMIKKPSTNGVSHIERMQYYFTSSQVSAHCGENSGGSGCSYSTSAQNDVTSFAYDALSRPTYSYFGDGGSTSWNYHGYLAPLTVTITQAADPNPARISTSVFDGFGRVSSTQDGQSGTIYRTYDALGRVQSLSNPKTSVTAVTDGDTTFQYDALGRQRYKYNQELTAPTSIRSDYANNVVDFYDELSHHWKRKMDPLGRVTDVFEPDPASNAPIVHTSYTYDASDNLTNVFQAGATDSHRTRSFTYDIRGRLLTSFNPEQGMTCYGLWSGGRPGSGSCGGGYDANGNLVHKTDSRGAVIDMAYDELNRLVSKQYSNTSSRTASSCYSYDVLPSVAPVPNGGGRLTATWTKVGPCTSSIPSSGVDTRHIIVAYDARGRIRSEQRCVGSACTNTSPQFSLSTDYDLAGSPLHFGNGIGTISFGMEYDSVGRLLNLTGTRFASQQNDSLFKATSFWPHGPAHEFELGGNMKVNREYDNRLRVTSFTVTKK